METNEYNIWDILGIETTRDEKKITEAYREKLSVTNPEDKPEEFKQLRSAYEEALAYARKPEGAQGEDRQIDEWLKQLADIYNDFAKRKNVENWEELFSQDICSTVSGHMRTEDELLRFLMEFYFLGHDVFLCMDRHYSFLERREELCEKYPRDFINNVIVNGILYEDILPMTMFLPGEDGEECQKYMGIYRNISLEEESRDKVEALLNLKERHPYGDAWTSIWKIRFEDPKYFEDLEKIAEEYPDDLNIGMWLAGEYYYAKEYEKAEKECNRLLEKHRDSIRLHRLYADILEVQEKYEEAVEQFNEIMRMADGEVKVLMEMNERRKKINPFIMERKKEYLKDHPEDIQAKIDLVWAYIQNDLNEEAEELFATMTKEETPAFDYYNIIANLTYHNKDYVRGIEALKDLITVIDELPEDSEKNISRKKRKGEMYTRMAYFYQELKDKDNAMKAYELALESGEDKGAVLTGMTQMAFREGDHEKALECAQRLVNEKPDSVYGYALLAWAHFYLRNDQEAYNAVSRALEMDGSDIGLYIMKIRILIRNNAFEEAEQVIEYLESYDLKEDPSVLYARGLLCRARDNDSQKAKEYYERSLEKIGDHGADYAMTDDLYLKLLYIEGETLDGNVKEDRDKMMEICEKGLSFNSRNKDLLEYKGWLLMMDGKIEESLEIYLELEKDKNHSGYVDYQIGRLYYKDLAHKARESRDHFLKALEKGYDHGGDFYVGMCELYMNHPDEAERSFMILKEKEPDGVDAYERLISVYQMKNDLDKALEYVDRLLEVSKYENVNFYIEKVQILRIRKEYEEAVRLLREAGKKFDRPVKKRIFDVYLEAGMYKEAEKELWKWKWDGEYYDAQITLNLLKGNFRKAGQLMNSHGKSLNEWRRNVLSHLLDMEKEDFIKDEEHLLAWKKTAEENNNDLAQVYEHLAFNAFHRNDTEKQHMYAEMAMEENEKDLQKYSLQKTLYAVRKYRMLSLLGRQEEAEELAQRIRKMPLCDHCQYCRCKDLEAFEMEAAELRGEYGKALELARQGHEDWPDEEDFAITMSRMERKVKKGC
ncbi:MAG: tetratricopeptide repeat protein [Erysipelotrichaceae bacterium]|nr:tetratricopeptide repeat protein [Erysipelotrichaceae bacterium]